MISFVGNTIDGIRGKYDSLGGDDREDSILFRELAGLPQIG
jgi:hypothetical protein